MCGNRCDECSKLEDYSLALRNLICPLLPQWTLSNNFRGLECLVESDQFVMDGHFQKFQSLKACEKFQRLKACEN